MSTYPPTMNDRATGLIRTYVGYGIGAVLAWLLVHTGVDLHGPFQAAVLVLVVALVTNSYYLAIRLLEVRFPFVGVFLGIPKAPDYLAVDNLWASFVRTAIPTVVSAVIVGVVAVWIDLNADQQASVIAAVVAIVSSLYYTVARSVVARWPRTKLLLGVSVTPGYLEGATA
jgi:hypothetical protein